MGLVSWLKWLVFSYHMACSKEALDSALWHPSIAMFTTCDMLTCGLQPSSWGLGLCYLLCPSWWCSFEGKSTLYICSYLHCTLTFFYEHLAAKILALGILVFKTGQQRMKGELGRAHVHLQEIKRDVPAVIFCSVLQIYTVFHHIAYRI